MKRVHEEIPMIRQQMEEDFLLHSERFTLQQQSILRVENAMVDVKEVILALAGSLDSLRSEFRDFAQMSQAHHESWGVERKRNLRLLDVIQSGMLTGG